jgi:hypothetical protein
MNEPPYALSVGLHSYGGSSYENSLFSHIQPQVTNPSLKMKTKSEPSRAFSSMISILLCLKTESLSYREVAEIFRQNTLCSVQNV